MPSYKSDIKITIEAADEKFSLNCLRLFNGRYAVKVGRSRSKKHPTATLTEITDLCRRWLVKKEKEKNL